MSEVKIIDAPVAPVATGSGCGVTNVSVPLKMDASMLAKALQAAASQQQQTVKVNPSEVIKEAVLRMEELYARFNTLRQLGAELNGKTMSEPVPSSLKIEDVAITFRLVKDNKESEPVVANIKNVVCVGDIAHLLSSELGTIIIALQQESAAIKETATTTEETCTKAREAWETNNPDRKIVIRPADNDTESLSAPSTPSLASSQVANAPPAV